MTEQELLDVFRVSASAAIKPGLLTPAGLLWVEQQIELAAARGANDSRLADAATARRQADEFFSAIFDNGPASFGLKASPLTPTQLEQLAATFAFWPFKRL
jgi:hypothetical protein